MNGWKYVNVLRVQVHSYFFFFFCIFFSALLLNQMESRPHGEENRNTPEDIFCWLRNLSLFLSSVRDIWTTFKYFWRFVIIFRTNTRRHTPCWFKNIHPRWFVYHPHTSSIRMRIENIWTTGVVIISIHPSIQRASHEQIQINIMRFLTSLFDDLIWKLLFIHLNKREYIKNVILNYSFSTSNHQHKFQIETIPI